MSVPPSQQYPAVATPAGWVCFNRIRNNDIDHQKEKRKCPSVEPPRPMTLAPGRKLDAGSLGALCLLGLTRGIGDYRRRQRDYEHLLELPDHLLADVGLTRPQVVAASRRCPF